MKRKAETITGLIGGGLALLIFGVFSVTVINMDKETFADSIYGVLPDTGAFQNVDEAFELIQQFSNWINLFLFLMLVTLVLATVFIFKNGKPKLAGVLYILSGVFLLVGTQGIGFPFAFLLFVSAYLSIVKKVPEDEPIEGE